MPYPETYGAHTTDTDFREILWVQGSSALLIYAIALIAIEEKSFK